MISYAHAMMDQSFRLLKLWCDAQNKLTAARGRGDEVAILHWAGAATKLEKVKATSDLRAQLKAESKEINEAIMHGGLIAGQVVNEARRLESKKAKLAQLQRTFKLNDLHQQIIDGCNCAGATRRELVEKLGGLCSEKTIYRNIERLTKLGRLTNPQPGGRVMVITER